jgi:carboxyl-terminal processing protease
MKRRSRICFPVAPLGIALIVATMGIGGPAIATPPGQPTTEANITKLTTDLLEHSQFAHHSLDTELASTFLDRYLDSLDGTRSLFLQSDMDDFAAYRANLAQRTRGTGDTGAAQAIYERFLQRLQQRVAYVTETLRTSTFDFTGHDTYSFDREHATRPHDLAAAQEIWRQQLRSDYLQEKLSDKPAPKIVAALTARYDQQLRSMKTLKSDEVLDVYLNALAHVYDPHSDYLGHEQMESFSIAMNLSLFGIGATLESADGYCTIRELVPGGPAARSGQLKAGDRIVSVAQTGTEPVDIGTMPLSRAVELIRGPKGSTVTLTILPAGASDGSPPRTASLVRDRVKLEDQEAKARIVDLPTQTGAALRLGIIDLPSFYAGRDERDGFAGRSATADVASLLNKLKAEHVKGVVLDLRRNGGGSLKEAISLTGLFIRTGPVVQTRDQAGDVDVEADNDPAVAYDGPLVLLTSRFSASASEILAGALQDYGRALVVGDASTFGKGTVQQVIALAPLMDRAHLSHAYDPGALKVTTNKFYRPSGASTQLRGVASDIVVPSTSDVSGVSESALKDPLPWDVLPPAPYDRLDRVEPYVSTLREQSALRVAKEKEFGALALDIAQVKKTMATKSVSLNEAERRQELAHGKARHETRLRDDREFLARSPTTYVITLKNASRPGLPTPTTFASERKKPSSAAVSPATGGRNHVAEDGAPDALILDEGERILADYVDLLGRHDSKNNPASP